MKKLMYSRILPGAAAIFAVYTMTAFGAEKLPTVTQPAGSSSTQEGLVSKDIAENPTQAVQNYVTEVGTIKSIEEKDENVTITIENDNMGMVFTVSSDVFVLNQKNYQFMSLSDLKEGMEISAVIPGNVPMTASLPPMTPGAVGFVVLSEGGFVNVGHYDENLINNKDLLKINDISQSNVTDQKGSKIRYSTDDLKDKDLLVIYDVSTRSIPAQINPQFVMLLNQIEVDEPQDTTPSETPEQTDKTPAPLPEPTAVEVGLRDAAEGAGFTIVWEGNDKPVTLEKDGVTISTQVGQKSIIIDGDMVVELSETTKLRDSKIFVSADIMEYLK